MDEFQALDLQQLTTITGGTGRRQAAPANQGTWGNTWGNNWWGNSGGSTRRNTSGTNWWNGSSGKPNGSRPLILGTW